MTQTISGFILLLAVLSGSVQVFANSSVPVSDLANDLSGQSIVNSKPLQPKLTEVSDVVAVVNTPMGNANAQMFDLVELLQRELQQLRGQVEELNYNLERLKQDQKQRYLDLDRRVVSLSSQPSVANETQVATVVSQTPQDGNEPALGQVIVAQETYDPEVEKAAYNAAFTLIRERQYDASIVALLAFVNDFQQGALLGNAHYWLGEVYMVQGDASLAAETFEIVIGEFPEHRKIPDALYKAGVAYQNVGNIVKANQMLQRVLKEYPDSSAARLAHERVN
jgi:tol-pal system protein YbgF